MSENRSPHKPANTADVEGFRGDPVNRRFCVAPMLHWTDRHCRYFHRQLSRHALLYSEMVTTGALVYGEPSRYLGHHPDESPLALQLGGHDPKQLSHCARLAEKEGFKEVNLNVGCPSDRVVNGRIGACLMAEPRVVAEAVAAMCASTTLPVTVKHRIGIDGRDSFDELVHFVKTVASGGCKTFLVHARIAVLGGLSPKENRSVPPLKPEAVYQLKNLFPELEIIINGGIESHQQIETHLDRVDGVMLGRAVYHNPWLLAEVDQRYFGTQSTPAQRHDIIEAMLPYIERECSAGVRLSQITRHMLGLYNGQPGAKRFRRYISENACRKTAGPEVVAAATRLTKQCIGQPKEQ